MKLESEFSLISHENNELKFKIDTLNINYEQNENLNFTNINNLKNEKLNDEIKELRNSLEKEQKQNTTIRNRIKDLENDISDAEH